MLEIPESSTLARQLNETVLGKTIKHVEANRSPHKFAWYYGDPEEYDTLLGGKKVGTAIGRGGMIEVQVEDCRLLFADGAVLKYFEDSIKASHKNQLYIEFTDGTALMATIQMYGGLWAYKEGQNDNPYYIGSCEKPSPLSNEFTYGYFRALYTEALEKKSVKAFLATEQRIPGIGNGVIQDLLYQAGIHPKCKMNTLMEADLEKLYHTTRKVLTEMIEGGGRDTEKDLYGNPGGYITYMSKNTYGEPCTKCGYQIRKENFLGGTVYYCEHCQKDILME
jgi:formamidopyrimidine-DNA glycosylase